MTVSREDTQAKLGVPTALVNPNAREGALHHALEGWNAHLRMGRAR